MEIPKCFISYCSDDIGSEVMEQFLDELEEKSNGRIEFLYDKNNKIGEQINKYMDQINICDSVIIICSPTYKEKISRPGENIEYEFSLIKKRLEQVEGLKKAGKNYDDENFAILPIIISPYIGKVSKEDAFPDFLDKKYFVYKRYTASNYQIRLGYNKTKLINKENETVIADCINQTTAIFYNRSVCYKADPDEIIQKIIENTKAESNGNLGKSYCETQFYKKLKHQDVHIIIGRKGSGKTEALKQLLYVNRNSIKGHIKINANDISLREALDYIMNPDDGNTNMFIDPNSLSLPELEETMLLSVKSDIKNKFSFEEFLDFVWIGYIYLYSIYVIACEHNNQKHKFTKKQSQDFERAFSYIDNIITMDNDFKWNNNESISSILFKYSQANAYKFYNELIQNARPNISNFQSDIQSKRNRHSFLRNLLGKDVEDSFTKTLYACKRKILISLDGFDIRQDYSRSGYYGDLFTENYEKAKFETLWLTSFLLLMNDLTSIQNNIFYDKLILCLMIPFDRYLEATIHKRDAFIFQSKVCSSNWSGLELAEMFCKRLEAVAGNFSTTEQEKYYYELIEDIIDSDFPYIPKEISIKLKNNSTIKVPLFLYLLRFSFWRPRDILVLIKEFFCQSYLLQKNRIKIDSALAKELIRLASEKIVTTDCLQEFSLIWTNIRESMNCFNGKSVIMSYEEFIEIISDKKFKIQLSNKSEICIDNDILRFMYELGFIGIILSPRNKERLRFYRQQNFVFYSGMKPLSELDSEDFKDNKIVLNPIFVNVYSLYIDTDEVLGIDCWETLKYYETIKQNDYIVQYRNEYPSIYK